MKNTIVLLLLICGFAFAQEDDPEGTASTSVTNAPVSVLDVEVFDPASGQTTTVGAAVTNAVEQAMANTVSYAGLLSVAMVLILGALWVYALFRKPKAKAKAKATQARRGSSRRGGRGGGVGAVRARKSRSGG